MDLKCKKKDCQYEWNYQGKAKFWATCPRCLRKVKVVKEENVEDVF